LLAPISFYLQLYQQAGSKVDLLSILSVIIAELQRPVMWSPIPYRKEKETHELIFSWLLWLASGIARGHVRMMTKAGTESRKIAAILQLIG